MVYAHRRNKGLAGVTPGGDTGQHVERDVGIGAEADGHVPGVLVVRHELGEHVRLLAHQVPRHVRVVEADAAALHGTVRQPRAGPQEEFVDCDVWWQAVLAQRAASRK